MNRLRVLLSAVTVICIFALINSCKKDPSLPTLTTSAVTNITVNSGTSGGSVTSDGGADVTARGVCWGTSTNPTITGSHTSDGSGTGSFTSTLADLNPNTLYYVRAYATNKAGTAYGNEVTATTSTIVTPTLSTVEVTSITMTTAVSGGNITSDGNAAVTARGVCWATTANPTITNSKTTDGAGTGTFASNLSALLPGTTYYVRAYATNSAGTSYGTQVSFITTAQAVPTLTTAEISAVTVTSAVSGGNITSDGGASVTARGICWATTANPTIANSKTTNGEGTGVYTSSMTSLVPGTLYHVRAYATNSVGTAYGNDLSFTATAVVVPTLTTTGVTSVTLTTAVSGGNVTADGGGSVTAKGVCWATAVNPTIANAKTTDGTGTGAFMSNITILIPGTTYYVRAYATNSAGTAYGNEISFTTTAVVLPTVTTTGATSITQTTAASGGSVTADGGGSVTARGVCWSTTLNPTITDSKTTNGSGTGTFTSALASLVPGTVYHIRAYATNSAGTAYGDNVTFTTNPVLVPTLTTKAASSITLTSAVSGGNITADGGGTVTARGVCWSLSANPTITDPKTTDGSGTGDFTSALTPLTSGTTYHVRAYATNGAGTAYGNDVTFTTTAVAYATLTTAAVTSITLNTASSGGDVTADGGGTVTARGVCWSTSPSPTIAGSHTTNGAGLGTFVSNLTGLTSDGTRYYVRAYATNSAGTTYGNEVIFNTNMADNDGNTYKTVTIGSQVWMAENLRTTKYSTSPATDIPNVEDNTTWSTLATGAYAWYENNGLLKDEFGALYNWFAVNSGDLCPAGWHAPTDEEFNTMELHIGIPLADINFWGWRGVDQGSQLKNTSGWNAGQNGTNTTGFSGLPGGYRSAESGSFNDFGNLSYWWTNSTEEANPTTAWYRLLQGDHNDIYKAAVEKQAGKYVRCVKDL